MSFRSSAIIIDWPLLQVALTFHTQPPELKNSPLQQPFQHIAIPSPSKTGIPDLILKWLWMGRRPGATDGFFHRHSS